MAKEPAHLLATIGCWEAAYEFVVHSMPTKATNAQIAVPVPKITGAEWLL